jgi:hypothetical protein
MTSKLMPTVIVPELSCLPQLGMMAAAIPWLVETVTLIEAPDEFEDIGKAGSLKVHFA